MADKPRNIRIIEYGAKPADQFTHNPANPRRHPQAQRDAVGASLDTLGWIAPVIENQRTGYVIDGHERLWHALQTGEDVPYVLVDLSPEEEAQALVTFDWITYLAEYDRDVLDGLMRDVQSDNAHIQQLISDMADDLDLFQDEVGFVDGDAKPNPRQLPIDFIYTIQMADCTCCLAVQAGLKYGIQSKSYRICPYCGKLSGRHKVVFIDNDYFAYDHKVHLAAVRELKPKYATVMDVVTERQAKRDGIAKAYPLEQVVDWAYELNEYAENVIIIPKYDCLDDIPDQFMLGYSVPTSHGGTPLPPSAFKGRRVHLLGGSWEAQLAHMAILGDDVISVDNNYIQKIASFSQFVTSGGETRQLQDVGLGYLNNPRYAALAISFGNIGAKINELYAVEEPASV